MSNYRKVANWTTKNTYETEKQLKIFFQEKQHMYHEVALHLHRLSLYITKRERLQGGNKFSELLHGVERTKYELRSRTTQARAPAHRHTSRKC